MAGLGVNPASLDAIFLSHEHNDHIRALTVKHPFSQRHGVPVYAPARFWRTTAPRLGPMEPRWCRTIEPGQTVTVGDRGDRPGRSGAAPLRVTAFAKSHDATDPVSFALSSAGERLGVVTDLGRADPDADAGLFSLLRGCEHLIFESNHDENLERASGRPAHLIARVLGPRGHLSNNQAGRALARLVTGATRSVVLAHLSLECNTPALALETVRGHLRGTAFAGRLTAAPPDTPGELLGTLT